MRWYVGIRGEMTEEIRAALERSGIRLTGMSHAVSVGGAAQESHGTFIDASTAEEALEKARSAVEGLPASPNPLSVKPAPED